MMLGLHIAAVLALCIGGGAAHANPMERAWCSQTGTMHIDAYGIGFNEHTICQLENLPVQMGPVETWSSAVACRNVHLVEIVEGERPEVIEMPVEGLTQITLRGIAGGTLVMSTDFHDEDIQFLPCDAN